MALALAPAWSAPVFVGVAKVGTDDPPQLVLAGQKAEFVLTMTSSDKEDPQLIVDLAAVAGGLAAPLLKDLSLELHRLGEVRAGIQRFSFSVEMPAAERKQDLLLRMKVRPRATSDWLPLPVVKLQAMPRTWKETLRRFARQVPCGRLATSENIRRVFQQAEVEAAEIPEGEPVVDQSIQVWFAEASDSEFRLPEGSRNSWVIFKRNVPGGLALWRPIPQAPVCITVEGDILDRLDTDAAAQDLFERALGAARALNSSSTDSVQSQP